jgi:hypothetical protein
VVVVLELSMAVQTLALLVRPIPEEEEEAHIFKLLVLVVRG